MGRGTASGAAAASGLASGAGVSGETASRPGGSAPMPPSPGCQSAAQVATGAATGLAAQPSAQLALVVPPGLVGKRAQPAPPSQPPDGPWQGVTSKPEVLSIQGTCG